MNQKKRLSLSVNTRLQPYPNTLMAEVAEWLNSHETSQKNDLIAEALIMAYLPYARAKQGVSQMEIERCCWETQDRLDKHGFNLRQSLYVAQPQWHSASVPSVTSVTSSHSLASGYQEKALSPQEEIENEEEDFGPSNLIAGEHSVEVDLFGDDDYD